MTNTTRQNEGRPDAEALLDQMAKRLGAHCVHGMKPEDAELLAKYDRLRASPPKENRDELSKAGMAGSDSSLPAVHPAGVAADSAHRPITKAENPASPSLVGEGQIDDEDDLFVTIHAEAIRIGVPLKTREAKSIAARVYERFAAQAPKPASGGGEQAAWMVERMEDGHSQGWYAGESFLNLTTDPNAAVRYPTKAAAEHFIKSLHPAHREGLIATEHLWLPVRESALEAADRAREASVKGEAISELPDDIRVPLDELWADAAYAFGRVASDGSCAGMFVESTRRKLDAAKTAIKKALAADRDEREK